MVNSVIGTQFTVREVDEYTLGNGVECWVVKLINERGEKYNHIFPKFTLEQRIAEYDLDPADITGAIEMVLYEAHIPDPTDYRNVETDAAAKRGLTVTSVKSKGMIRAGQLVPVTLHTAPDRVTARQAHQARIDEVKTRITISSGKGVGILSRGDLTDPLQLIHANHGVDPDRVKSRAAYVQYLMAVNQGFGNPDDQLFMTSPGGIPVKTMVRPQQPYDPAVRRRGLTVALLDSPQE